MADEEITPIQQRFIEELLSGKSVTDAAHDAGCSRRAACYWLVPTHAVYKAYERQRRTVHHDFEKRVQRVHQLAMQALEDLLGPKAPPGLRFQAMKLVYESHLRDQADVQWPATSEELISNELQRELNPSPITIYLYDQKNRERITEDD